MFKYILIAVLMGSACTPTATAPAPPTESVTLTQDLESCTRQPELPWCVAECKKSDRQWC